MLYDIEIILPVCRRYSNRVKDFKRYGLLNTSGRKVLVNIIVSDEDFEGLEEGWPEGVEVRVKNYENPHHVSNIYRFYADLKKSELNSKWLMRVDDDSCTDVGGLLSNLELLYDWEAPFYLGDMTVFGRVLEGHEGHVYNDYKHLLGDLEVVAPYLSNEIECGIISKGAMERILGDDRCVRLIRQRSQLKGGYGDCVTALAATMVKVPPVQCPFLSHLPRIAEFSLFGGHLNHIHAIARDSEGDNFHEGMRSGNIQFEALTRRADGIMTDMELSVSGRRFLLETENELGVYEFMPDRTASIKFDRQKYIWMEVEGSIIMFAFHRDIHRTFKPDESGGLVGHCHDGNRIVLKPIPTQKIF